MGPALHPDLPVMVNFQDPAEIVRDFMVLVRFESVTDGIYIWEFLTTLKFEWDVIRGRRPYRWTIWIYSIARLSTFMPILMTQIGSYTTLTSCQALISLAFTFGQISLAFSSWLILLRISPIWNKNKVAVSLATGVWLTNVGFLIYGAAAIRSTAWNAERGCPVLNIQGNLPTYVFLLVTDVTLLLIMLVGLIRLYRDTGRWFDLGRFLWKQGVIWLFLATVAELVPVVFVCLNLNDAFSMMFLMPTTATMTIAATRMYRGLADFCSHSDVVISSGSAPRSSHPVQLPPRDTFTISTHDQLEAAVRTTSLPSPRDNDAFFITIEGQRRDKPLELSLHEDAKSSV